MATIVTLRPEEAAQVDLESLEILFNNLGPRKAEEFTGRALDELVRRIDELRRAIGGDDAAALAGQARGLARVATQIGLVGLARVARDLGGCAVAGDRVALAAIWARFDRLAAPALSGAGRIRDARN